MMARRRAARACGQQRPGERRRREIKMIAVACEVSMSALKSSAVSATSSTVRLLGKANQSARPAMRQARTRTAWALTEQRFYARCSL